MKNAIRVALLFLFIFQAGCMPQSRSSADLAAAQDTLVSFFSLLAYHAYSQVVDLWGGGYDTLLSMNPDLTTDDPGLIWQRACEVNGFQCLEIKQVLSAATAGVDEYHFMVQFINKDGSLFELNLGSGDDTNQISPQSKFEFMVKREKGRFTVRTLPIYES